MENSILDELLEDRLILHEEVSDIFIVNMRLRLHSGIPQFGLVDCNLKPIYCSTIDKHTCVQVLNDDKSTFYLILDEHHFKVLCLMNYVFYLYGQVNLKLIMNRIFRAPEKKLFQVSVILLAEKCMLVGNATKAKAYLDKLKEYEITRSDFDGAIGKVDLSWLMLKEKRERMSRPMVMNYYVFHELAHIKAQYAPESFLIYENEVRKAINLVQPAFQIVLTIDKSKIPIEDIACDMYALDLLFDYAFDEYGDYQYEYMVDSYIGAIMNLTIMDSVVSHDEIENWYVDCWVRIIIALYAVAIRKVKQLGKREFYERIETYLKYGREKYENYHLEILRAINDLTEACGNIQEKYSVLSTEWVEEQKNVLAMLAAIK